MLARTDAASYAAGECFELIFGEYTSSAFDFERGAKLGECERQRHFGIFD